MKIWDANVHNCWRRIAVQADTPDEALKKVRAVVESWQGNHPERFKSGAYADSRGVLNTGDIFSLTFWGEVHD